MARGGAGRNQGRKKGSRNVKKTEEAEKEKADEGEVLAPLPENPILPLDHMLKVLNDPNTTPDRKDRMAQMAAPFCHARAGEKGKKEGKDEAAKKAASGRFAPSSAPNVVPMKKQG